jgi:hypothetical protein
MGIKSIIRDEVGKVGVAPGTILIVTTDNYATITAANYLNAATLEGISIAPTDVVRMIYSYVKETNTGTYQEFLPSFSNGIITLSRPPNAGSFKNVTVLTTPGVTTFTVPTLTTTVFIKMWGAGGGSGGGTTTAGGSGAGGGGGGGYLEKTLTVNGGDTLTCTVGIGGAGGVGDTVGSPGTASTIVYNAVTYTAGGGLGGTQGSISAGFHLGGAGGTATNGDVNIQGGTGQAGLDSASTFTSGWGAGGDAAGGGANGTQALYAFGAGNPGIAPGGGASGANTTTAQNGAAGGNGMIVLYYN